MSFSFVSEFTKRYKTIRFGSYFVTHVRCLNYRCELFVVTSFYFAVSYLLINERFKQIKSV